MTNEEQAGGASAGQASGDNSAKKKVADPFMEVDAFFIGAKAHEILTKMVKLAPELTQTQVKALAGGFKSRVYRIKCSDQGLKKSAEYIIKASNKKNDPALKHDVDTYNQIAKLTNNKVKVPKILATDFAGSTSGAPGGMYIMERKEGLHFGLSSYWLDSARVVILGKELATQLSIIHNITAKSFGKLSGDVKAKDWTEFVKSMYKDACEHAKGFLVPSLIEKLDNLVIEGGIDKMMKGVEYRLCHGNLTAPEVIVDAKGQNEILTGLLDFEGFYGDYAYDLASAEEAGLILGTNFYSDYNKLAPFSSKDNGLTIRKLLYKTIFALQFMTDYNEPIAVELDDNIIKITASLKAL